MVMPRERMLRAADGTKLFLADSLLDADTARGGVILMHGLGEHCGRYAHVREFFNRQGWSVRTYDHRGHGRSGGAVGDVPDDEVILQDAHTVITSFAAETGSAPLLFGHSMGGLFAARVACAGITPLRGLILSSPALALPLTPMQRMLSAVMRRLAPGMRLQNGLETQFLTHDSDAVDAYLADPLVHPKISARLLHCMLAAIDFSQAHAASLTIPTLMLVAGADQLVDADGSRKFFAQLAPGIGELHIYENFYHEIFNETGAQQVFDDLHAWLVKHAWAAAPETA
jgi:alpha-beta hydrolase superfamily lysophospholipase